MTAPIEGHVLKEMGQAALPGLLKNASHTLCDIKIGYMRRLGIMGYVISKPIGQRAFVHRRIHRQRLGNGRSLIGAQQQ